MYNKITAELKVVTPMFIGNGNQEATSIRPSSIKGALRFWWRALNWERLYLKSGSEPIALKQLRSEEIALFGGAVDRDKGGQGVVSVRVKNTECSRYQWEEIKSGVAYLMGIGLYSYKERATRTSLAPDTSCTLDLVLKKATSEQKAQLIEAVKLFGLIGGLGSRSRKGFGSVSVTSMSVNGQSQPFPTNQDEYQAELQKIFAGYKSGQLAPFTALSGLIDSDISVSGRSWEECLQLIGKTQQMYRSYGRSPNPGAQHKVAGAEALQLFRGDHDLIFNFLQNRQIDAHPERIVFGLPHNYFFSSIRKKVDISGVGSDSRRSSPLFVHVHKFGNGDYAAVQTLLPAHFYPENGKLSYNRITLALKAEDINWQVIRDYMRQDKYVSESGLSYPGFVNRSIISKGVECE